MFERGEEIKEDPSPSTSATAAATSQDVVETAAGVVNETIYLCNFRVSVDGEWLCLKELDDSATPGDHHQQQDILCSPSMDYSSYYHSLKSTSADSPEYPIYGPKDRDPILIERSNLVNILKLVIKEVIDSSMRFGRQLDSDHIPLQHFFIVLEHVLRHGLKPKKGLLGPKKELWDILQLIEKRDLDAADITASVRDLPTVKTHMGRARAWLRLALMQKKLSDYFRVLIEMQHRDEILAEYYEPQALLRSEEAVLVMGLLVSLNIVDCNLCVKEEDLDCQQGVIDFSLYLRNKKDTGVEAEKKADDDESLASASTQGGQGRMSTVLDQKNYIEELNRHLNATVTNLEAKVETLTTTNALMKEDLAICKQSLFRAEEENRKLISTIEKSAMQQIESTSYLSKSPSTVLNTSDNADRISLSSKSSYGGGGENHSSSAASSGTAVDDESPSALKAKLQEEVQKREQIQRELSLQTSMKAEMEMAMKLLEKDVHEKQDTIISLRDQLEDIKQINLEMYTKLQECEISLKHKTELVNRLEVKSAALADTLHKLDEKYLACEREKQNCDERLKIEIEENRRKIEALESDLKIEREWRIRLQEAAVEDKEKIANMTQELEFLQKVTSEYDTVISEHKKMSDQVAESEKTLEELGQQLVKSKLQVDSMKEEHFSTWQDDSAVHECPLCSKEFNISRRKHHCRNCGQIFCDNCSDNKMKLASSGKPVRVCDNCYTVLLDRFSKLV